MSLPRLAVLFVGSCIVYMICNLFNYKLKKIEKKSMIAFFNNGTFYCLTFIYFFLYTLALQEIDKNKTEN